jgi:hypothetical protein
VKSVAPSRVPRDSAISETRLAELSEDSNGLQEAAVLLLICGSRHAVLLSQPRVDAPVKGRPRHESSRTPCDRRRLDESKTGKSIVVFGQFTPLPTATTSPPTRLEPQIHAQPQIPPPLPPFTNLQHQPCSRAIIIPPRGISGKLLAAPSRNAGTQAQGSRPGLPPLRELVREATRAISPSTVIICGLMGFQPEECRIAPRREDEFKLALRVYRQLRQLEW